MASRAGPLDTLRNAHDDYFPNRAIARIVGRGIVATFGIPTTLAARCLDHGRVSILRRKNSMDASRTEYRAWHYGSLSTGDWPSSRNPLSPCGRILAGVQLGFDLVAMSAERVNDSYEATASTRIWRRM
jgi:hypothetical protein